jgi:hypothetical protein
MLPKPSSKYVGCGPLTLAKLAHEFEGEDDIEFLAVQDAVSTLTAGEQEAYRLGYIDRLRRKG